MNRKILIGAILINALALVALLGYSIERTAWLFDLFEDWTPAARAAAVVVELAAVALLVGAGALAHLDEAARAWANRALVAVLSVQALANLSAGYLRGGRETLALFAGSNELASYAVAATLWFAVNLAVPGLILCLSKLLERLIAAWQNASDLPLRELVASLRELVAGKDRLLASATADLSLARESETELREQIENLSGSIAHESAAAANVLSVLTSKKEELARRESELANLKKQLEEAREEASGLRELAPTQARIVAYVREQMGDGRSLLEIAREIGFSESTVRGWLKPATNGHLIEEV